jgi:hypothetical protein
MSPKLNNLIENKKTSYLTPRSLKKAGKSGKSIFNNHEEVKDNISTISNIRVENVVREINISITPKHLK